MQKNAPNNDAAIPNEDLPRRIEAMICDDCEPEFGWDDDEAFIGSLIELKPDRSFYTI